jgi:hypothetical protein
MTKRPLSELQAALALVEIKLYITKYNSSYVFKPIGRDNLTIMHQKLVDLLPAYGLTLRMDQFPQYSTEYIHRLFDPER